MRPLSPAGRRDRAIGALAGLAVGDALGMPTQSLPRAAIADRYGGLISGFEPGPPDHPLAAGLSAGSVTDDTEQAVIVARLVIDGHGTVDPGLLASSLLAWEESMRARGSLDLLGPSTRRALDALLAGADPAQTGRAGTTNGAAMRITPVGVATIRLSSRHSPTAAPLRARWRTIRAFTTTRRWRWAGRRPRTRAAGGTQTRTRRP